MARRSDHSRQELQALSIDVAYRRIDQFGLRDLSVRKVATDIGYSPGTIYNVFQNMDDLVMHVAARVLDEFYADADRNFVDRGALEGLHQLVEAYIEFAHQRANIWQTVVGYRLPDEATLPDFYVARVQRLLGLIIEGMSPFIGDRDTGGRLKCAITLWAATQGLVSMAARSKLHLIGQKDVVVMAKDLVTHYVEGLSRTG